MKKILIVLSLILLSACSTNHYSKVSDGENVLFSSNDGNISFTKQDLYETMKSNDVAELLKIRIIEKLAIIEGIDVDSIKSEVEESVNQMVEAGYESFIISYYGSVENYKNSSISNAALVDLCENEVNNNFEQYVSDNDPYKAEIVYFDTKEAAEAVLDAVNNNENTFEYACSENGYSSEVTETLYTDTDSDLPVDVKEWVLNTSEPTLSDIIEVSTTVNDSDGNSTVNTRYYLVNLISKNVEDFKEEFVSNIVSTMDKDTVINSLLEKHSISIHDQRIYELLKEEYEAIK